MEARRRAGAVGARPPGDPRELLLRHHLPVGAGELPAADGAGEEDAAAGRALPLAAEAVPLAPPVRPRRLVAGLGGEAGAHGWRPMGARQHGGAQSWGAVAVTAAAALC